MKEFWKNPRSISDFEMNQLKKNIEELGDLSGITHDINTDEIITGNQRVKALGLESKDPVIIHKNEKPDSQGTLAIGYFELEDGTRMNYRKVKWDESQRDKANITANKLGGEWNMDILENKDLWSKDLLVDSGFKSSDFGKFKPNLVADAEKSKLSKEDFENKNTDKKSSVKTEQLRTILCPHCLKEFEIENKIQKASGDKKQIKAKKDS